MGRRLPKGNSRYTLLDRWVLLAKASCDPCLSRGDLAVMCVLLNHVDPMGQAYPGPDRIAKHAKIDRRTVKRCLRRLETLNYVKIERPGPRVRNTYWPVFETKEPSTPNASAGDMGGIAALTGYFDDPF